ncbi:RICIN domain-containing protein [Streptomyces sp. NPDC088400]|uniref:RICIN domain-containing protein n=1 Tax=Streptomyces sp. NPDC088400 TaxID=3365861 RepID=UPI00382BD3C2
MARQQEPFANTPSETSSTSSTSSTSDVTVRRAVTVSGATSDPGDDLAPGGPRRDGVPAAADTGSSSTGASAAANAPTPGRPGDSVLQEAEGAEREGLAPKSTDQGSDEPKSADRGSDEPTPGVGPDEAGRADSAAEEDTSASASAASATAAPSAATASSSAEIATSSASAASASSATTGSASAAAVAQARGGGAGSATGEQTPPGGPKKPMLAAAAIIGTILIAVPVVVLLQNDDEPSRPDRIEQAGGTVLDTARSANPGGDYTTESPSPSASPTVKPSNTVKQPPPATSAAPSPSKKTDPKADAKADAKAAAEALRRKANAASSASRVLLKNTTTGLCADVPGFGKGANETRVNQYPCNGTDADNQLWDLVVSDKDGGPKGAALFQIRNSKDSLCLDLPGRGATPGMTRAQQYACDLDNDNQRWWLDPRPDGTYWIRNFVSDGLCLNVKGKADRRNDVPLDLGQCEDTSADDDRWTFA